MRNEIINRKKEKKEKEREREIEARSIDRSINRSELRLGWVGLIGICSYE